MRECFALVLIPRAVVAKYLQHVNSETRLWRVYSQICYVWIPSLKQSRTFYCYLLSQTLLNIFLKDSRDWSYQKSRKLKITTL